ncbi:MAG TPA: serine/threonine-protein kinase [Candidatus Binatia bacterium]|nr:serine/threonine-protein kinase [Candidatus Binatia bacterium]
MGEQGRKRLGDYEIVRELGHGGMGQVFLVRNVISDRIEAMKVLLPDLAQQQELANRFIREIKLLASLEHPNIAQLRTAFTAENQLVMIMEYVEGDTLAHRLERGAFLPADAVNYISQVLTALSYAHLRGIIHRDIKPANMMLTPQGVVKLMDFGIARATGDLGMTVTGTTLGSLDYMSPEQVKSEPTDARSDLYSVGVSLYEMLTGHRMFSATSSYSVMEAHVKEIPRAPIEVQPRVPKALSDIVMMAVAKEAAQRFQTADALRNALSQAGVSAAAAAGVQQPQAVMTPIPVAPPASVTPTPVSPASMTPQPATPAPQPGAYAAPQPQAARGGGRHIGWLLAAAIVILVALFGGTQVYRVHRQNAAIETAAPRATTPAEAPAVAAPAPMEPAAAPNVPPEPRAPAGRHGDRGGNLAQGAAPENTGPSPEEIAAQKKLLEEMETETDQLESRAQAVESSLSAMEQQMRQSGFGLRGDVVSARSSMRNDLAKAKEALDSSDTDRARRYLDQASRELGKLEAFLGR